MQAEPAGNRTKAACKDESGAVRQHTRRYKSKKKDFLPEIWQKVCETESVYRFQNSSLLKNASAPQMTKPVPEYGSPSMISVRKPVVVLLSIMEHPAKIRMTLAIPAPRMR